MASGEIDASAVPSYLLLLERVQKKTLSVTFILGLPRGGTTAIEKHLHSHLPYDGNVNEPSLHLDFGSQASSPEERAELTFVEVLQSVQRLEQGLEAERRCLQGDPLRVLVKEVTNKVLPMMIPLWTNLAAAVLVIFRNPSLQLESRLKSIVDRVKSGALKSFGLTDDQPCDELLVHGKRVMIADPMGSASGSRSFRDAYKDMVSCRNFSMLGPGFLRLQTLHPFCADPFSQTVMWGSERPLPPPALSEFQSLSDELCSQLLSWRLGWEPLRQQLLRLTKHPHVLLLDFSSFQIAPDHLTSAVDDALCSQCPTWAKAVERKRLAGKSAGGQEATHDFSLRGNGWDDASWQAWYGMPCYDKVSRRTEVEPVLKAPAPASQFPASCQLALRAALNVYSSLSEDSRAVRPPSRAAAPFIGIDPLYDGLWLAGATSSTRSAAVEGFLGNVSIKEPQPEQSTLGIVVASLHRMMSVVALFFVQTLLLGQTAVVYAVLRMGASMAALLRDSNPAPFERLPETCLVTVIIPSYNEEAFIATALHSVRGADAAKFADSSARVEVVVVVDAGTNDLTANVVQRIAASEDFPFNIKRVSSTQPGRGAALSEGVKHARGHILLFLHADCVLPPSWDTMVVEALRKPDVHATAFRFRLNRDRLSGGACPPGLYFLELATQLRSSMLRLPFGDQAVALCSSQLVEVGGFPTAPIFEDYSLMLSLTWQGGFTGRRLEVLSQSIGCGPRRFEQKGLWWTSVINVLAISAYLCGMPTSRIFQLYYGRKP